jgi:threonine dehydratase
MSKLPVALADIEKAAASIRGAVLRTPTVPSPALSAIAGVHIVLKLETQHPTGSFKERGALTKLLSLGARERRRGVIAMSAGNHAQGVAYHARRLKIPATIVMPADTPFTKVERTERLGARVILEGEGLAGARRAAQDFAVKHRLTLIHPYDDASVIAGQGTVALEFLGDAPELDALIVPVGGGGLMSGIAVAARALRPKIALFGVECAGYASMLHALGRGTAAQGGATLAEGIAVKEPGKLTRRIVKALVDDIFVVDDEAIERAVALLVSAQRLAVEGAGAAPLAALFANRRRFRGKRVGLVISGGNIDARLLASIVQRDLARQGRLVRLRVELSDAPGALARVASIIGERGGNIVEITHQRLFFDVPVKMAEVDVVVETRNAAHVGEIVAALSAHAFPAHLLSSTALDAKD